jgi:hypothetical protein
MPITTTPSGGPQGEFSTYTPIYAQTLSSATDSITFSNIPTTFTDLVLVCSTGYTSTNIGQGISFRFNNDSATNYSVTYLEGDGTSASSYRGTSQTSGGMGAPSNGNQSSLTPMIFSIQNYSNPTTFKTWIGRTSGPSYIQGVVGLWRATPQPITSITVFAGATATNIKSGSSFTLYGIKAAAPAPKATGGDVITTDGTYWYHAFKSTGLFEVKQAISCDVLQIAGGGSGAYCYSVGAGGGGAGGLLYYTSQSLSPSTKVVTVGAGGAPRFTYSTGNGYQGNNSQFGSLTASVGGGYGAGGDAYGAYQGGTGGSGGGSAHWNYSGTLAGGSATSGQGSAGGSISGNGGNRQGAGGGGAGAAGGNTTTSTGGGGGGAGTNTYSAWATATSTGVSGYYAGGGGGGGNESGNNTGSGGSGGGGSAGRDNNSVGGSGVANTGSGGGAAYGSDNTPTASGAGGSGLVIVRYAV